eukprot:gene462-583_t
MAIIGEYLCMRKELKDIPLSRPNTKEFVDSTPFTTPAIGSGYMSMLTTSTTTDSLNDLDNDNNNIKINRNDIISSSNSSDNLILNTYNGPLDIKVIKHNNDDDDKIS